ncbi:MAG: peptidoglycan DD-metalloendopeptidase family protein [Burkholderiales bacterium]|nr:peptidoglycan DD-metalloendopeptidase family protein [Burkholderiales bacterium]
MTRHLFFLLLGLAISGEACAGSRQDLGELHSRIDALEKDLGKKEASQSELNDQLKKSEIAISNSERKLRDLSAMARDADRSLAKLGNESEAIRTKITSQQQLLGQFLYQRYLNGNEEYLKLLLDSRDPNEISRNMQYLSYVAKARKEMLAELRQDLSRLDALETSTRQQRADLADIVQKQRKESLALEEERKKRKAVLAGISAQIGKQKEELSRLKRDEQRLKRLFERIGKSAKHAPSPVLKNESVPEATQEKKPFAKLKGQLRLPVKGILTNRFGAPRMNGGLVWKGLFIRAATGEEVRAIAAGRVVFADWLRGFGNIIIRDHGDGYMSLYGDNETLLKNVGEWVRGGEVIAEVGNSGGNSESGLYFELREQGVPLDPMKWVNVK